MLGSVVLYIICCVNDDPNRSPEFTFHGMTTKGTNRCTSVSRRQFLYTELTVNYVNKGVFCAGL